jgi:flagellin
MSLSILNNLSSLTAENNLDATQTNLQSTLTQLSSGSKINSGADDPAGLSIANGLTANISALTQSVQNATNGTGLLQTADGALSQVTTLLNSAVTLAQEASSSGLTTAQSSAIQSDYTAILAQITNINSTTNFNGTAVFGNAGSVYLGDGTSTGSYSVSTAATAVDPTADLKLSAAATALTTTGSAQTELTAITAAIATVAQDRGTIGAAVNQLTAATNVMNTQIQNLTSAESGISDADIGKTVANMSKFSTLEQTGIAALQQANQSSQTILKLIQ